MAPDADSRVSAWRAPVALAFVVVVADQLSKHWALNRLSGNRTIDLVGSLRFNLAFNKGMAFSQGQGLGPLIAVVATVVIVWLLVSLRTTGGRLNTFGIGCVIGGAAGNLIDRAFRQEAWLRGAVVDFIDLQWFPIFNIADSAINIGAGALILNAILSARRANRGDALRMEGESGVGPDEIDDEDDVEDHDDEDHDVEDHDDEDHDDDHDGRDDVDGVDDVKDRGVAREAARVTSSDVADADDEADT